MNRSVCLKMANFGQFWCYLEILVNSGGGEDFGCAITSIKYVVNKVC